MSNLIQYDDESEFLRAEVRRWLDEHFDAGHLRAFVAEEDASDEKFWNAAADLGWTGLVISEEYGGAGMGTVPLCVLAEETGRSLFPAPVVPTLVAGLAVAQGGSEEQRRRWLPALASGSLRASLAVVNPDGDWDAHRSCVRREAEALSGEKHLVWGGGDADLFVVPFLEEGEARCAVIDARGEGIAIEPEVTIDRTRRSARVVFNRAPAPDEDLLVLSSGDLFGRLLPFVWTSLAAEAAGGADALLRLTAGYAATRQQFGKPIGSLQAVKHPLVNVLLEVEKTRSLVYGAATSLDEGRAEAESQARMAKAQGSDAYVFAASRAVQFHGGFGFTEDCDVHYYLKRARGLRPAFGDAGHHRRWIGRFLRESGPSLPTA